MSNKTVTNFKLLNETIDVNDARINDDLMEKLAKLSLFDRSSTVVSVGGAGMFSTIQEAVNYLVGKIPQISTSPTNPIMGSIIIQSGTYNESIDLGAKSGILFYGLGNVTITSDSGYPTCTMNGFGTNEFYNITFRNTNSSNAYAYHYEAGGVEHSSLAYYTKFVNCSFISITNGGAGIGCANQNTNIWFDNCSFAGANGRDLYFHNSTYDGSANNYIRFTNCIAGTVRIDDSAHIDANRSSVLGVLFNNNNFRTLSFYGGNQGSNAGTFSYIPYGHTNIVMSPDNYGNVGVAFNYLTQRQQIEGYYIKGEKGSWDSYGYNIYCPNCSAYSWSVFQAIANDGTNIKGSISIVVNSGNNNLTLKDTSSAGVGGMTNIVVIGVPK